MRPVNLLPEGSGPRSGLTLPVAGNAIGYAVIGGLVVVLLGVLAMVHYSNQIGEKQDEIARLEATEAETRARAANLTQFTNFQIVRESRAQTITALAESRFDWERVMRELAIVLPERVWLTNLTGTVSPDVTVENAAATSLRGSVPGPALQLIGCARSQRDVARLIGSLEDIDGVTRVTVEDSLKPDGEVTGSGSGEETTSEDCRTRDFVTQFTAVAAFDAVSVPDGAEPTTPVTPPAPAAEATSEPAPETTTTASTDPTDGAEAATDENGEALEQLGAGGKQR